MPYRTPAKPYTAKDATLAKVMADAEFLQERLPEIIDQIRDAAKNGENSIEVTCRESRICGPTLKARGFGVDWEYPASVYWPANA